MMCATREREGEQEERWALPPLSPPPKKSGHAQMTSVLIPQSEDITTKTSDLCMLQLRKSRVKICMDVVCAVAPFLVIQVRYNGD